MMLVAAGGLAAQWRHHVGTARRAPSDINIRSAFVHMLGDLLGSVAIIPAH